MSHRCIKPQCPRDCSECNHALPEEDEAAMLVCDLLDDFAVDGFGAPLEDGESELVDRWRAWLTTRRSANLPELPTCTKSQTADFVRVMPTISMRKFGFRHPNRDDGSYGVALTVTGLTSEQQAEAAMVHMQRLFCGAEISEQ